MLHSSNFLKVFASHLTKPSNSLQCDCVYCVCVLDVLGSGVLTALRVA